MSDLLLYLLKANIALGFFFLGYYLWLRKLTFYKINRYYLAVALVFSATYPFIPVETWFVPSQDIPSHLLLDFSDWRPIPIAEEPPLAANGLSTAYWISVGLFGVLFLIKLMGIGRIHLRSVPARWGLFQYRSTSEDISPFSFWTNIYFNPSLHREEEYLKIFKHEEVHVRQLHSVDILLAEVSLIFFWYNPFCWMLRKAVEENIEFITDQKVLASGIDKKSYQYSLVQISTSTHLSEMGNHFNFKNLKKRIIMMNKKQSSKMQLGKYLLILPAVIVGSLIFGVSDARDNPKSQPMVMEVVRLDVQDTLKQKNPKENLHPGGNNNGAKPFIDNIHKTYPPAIQVAPVTETPPADSQDTVKKEPLYIINGEKQTPENPRNYRPEEIASVNVLKDKAAIAAYGEDGKNGVIEITTKPLVLIDGRIVPYEDMDKLDPAKIKSLNVGKGEAQSIYGSRAKNGVIEITTLSNTTTGTLKVKEDKDATDLSGADPSVKKGAADLHSPLKVRGATENVLFIIDGEKTNGLETLNPDDIESITVYKGEQAVEKYGEEGKEGVIEITTKQ